MPSKKDNIRSFRYSSEVAAILERQEGDNLNAKFESLVIWCNLEKPKIDKQIEAKRQYVAALQAEADRLRKEIAQLQILQAQKARLVQQYEALDHSLSSLIDRVQSL